MEIEISGLKKVYEDLTVLDIEHLKLHKNAITAIVGPNGAGKSTLLSLIAGLNQASAGTILYDQKETIPYKQMTLVFQEPYLINTSVKDNIAYPLKIRKQPKEVMTKTIQQLSTELHIEHLLNKNAHQLSLGEIQKVALARALSFAPNILLLDEPSASIDPYTTQEIENMLSKMKNTTILIITHNLAQAKRLADYVVLLNQGKVVESLDVDTFFNHPTSSVTKKFIEGELLI